MVGRIRVLDNAKRIMQRLGYLKLLCALVKKKETSNLASLGKKLIDRVTAPVRLVRPLEGYIRDYIKARLTDGAYRDLRKAVLNGTSEGSVSVEIQDLYLADESLPSRTGKLVKRDSERYPYFGTTLDLVKKGTYSTLTRSLVLLAVTPKAEIDAFSQWDREHNPMKLSDAQAMVLLYCFLDNDAEVAIPLFSSLHKLPEPTFDERVAGDMLPNILRQMVRENRNRGLTGQERERLAALGKIADSVAKWKDKPYTGGGAREEAIRVRLEPYCDLGFFTKPNRDRYEYQKTDALRALLDAWNDAGDIGKFLAQRFFTTFAACRGLTARPADDSEATEALVQAGDKLKSSLGYTPITDVGLLAGIRLLAEKGAILELKRSADLLDELQKLDPTFVRFTVDRMGTKAHVKFLKTCSGGGS
jgi:hypothetical protein